MINVFYIIDLIVNLVLAAGFAFRYRQTQVKSYLYLGLAVCGFLVGDVLYAFLLGDLTLTLIIVYVGLAIYALSGLVFVMVVLKLLRTWITSMRRAPAPAAHKLDKSEKLAGYLRYAYPGLTLLSILFFVLLIVSFGAAAILSILVGLLYTICIVTQLAVCVWMWLDIQSVATTSQITKRNQLVRIAALTFFSAWPSMFSGFGVGIGASICWWVFYGIALWPNALVGYELEPEAPGQGQYQAEPDYYKDPNQQPQGYYKDPNQV